MCVRTVGIKNAPFLFRSVPFRFTGNERAEKMACRSARSVPSVPPVLPSSAETWLMKCSYILYVPYGSTTTVRLINWIASCLTGCMFDVCIASS